ncbi:MAG: ANTAR domain-containing protein [Azospirillum sp.]|nr:ANTAR domain-containing protein [Azospirillum sp.]
MTSIPDSQTLRILLVDDDGERSSVVEEGLAGSGYHLVAQVPPTGDLATTVKRLAPDVIIIDAQCPSRDTLEHMRLVGQDVPRPIVMFVDRNDEDMTLEAIRAGVSAYIVDGLNRQSVRPVIDLAIARFREFQKLRTELEQAKAALEERKTIERAKGILMQQRGWTEEQAYHSMRRMAMAEGLKLGEVARNVVLVAPMLKG